MTRRLLLMAATFAAASVDVRADDSVAPYVPTVEEDVELMLEVADVGPGDYLIDLGSGDGRIVISAARRGAAGHGVEIEQALVTEAEGNAEAAGVAERVAFIRGDIFEADIAAATVVSLYLFPEANLMLRPKLLAELRPGTRVVSNSFHMEDWLPDEHDMTARSSGGILLWIIPARIDGDWVVDVDGVRWPVSATQRHQAIELAAGSGPDAADGAGLELGEATLRGDRIAFVAEHAGTRYHLAGRVDSDRIEGYARIEQDGASRVARWSATRRNQGR